MSGKMDPARLDRIQVLASSANVRQRDWGDPETWRGTGLRVAMALTSTEDFDIASYLAASRPEVVLALIAEVARLRESIEDLRLEHREELTSLHNLRDLLDLE